VIKALFLQGISLEKYFANLRFFGKVKGEGELSRQPLPGAGKGLMEAAQDGDFFGEALA
jgi:hypothetical protein